MDFKFMVLFYCRKEGQDQLIDLVLLSLLNLSIDVLQI